MTVGTGLTPAGRPGPARASAACSSSHRTGRPAAAQLSHRIRGGGHRFAVTVHHLRLPLTLSVPPTADITPPWPGPNFNFGPRADSGFGPGTVASSWRQCGPAWLMLQCGFDRRRPGRADGIGWPGPAENPDGLPGFRVNVKDGPLPQPPSQAGWPVPRPETGLRRLIPSPAVAWHPTRSSSLPVRRLRRARHHPSRSLR
jgi:hypothetical protein